MNGDLVVLFFCSFSKYFFFIKEKQFDGTFCRIIRKAYTFIVSLGIDSSSEISVLH